MARYALLIGTDTYDDPSFADLLVPGKDVEDLHSVLTDKKIADFPAANTRVMLNCSQAEVRKAVGAFFKGKKKDDLLLFYFSGHGELDEDNDLYLALGSTEKANLMGTALEASMVENAFRKCRATQQIIILDCCYSGVMSGKSTVDAKELDGWKGYGREILTSSSAAQKSWEAQALGVQSENSLFTHYLVEGLKTGKAANSDLITVEQLFNYARKEVTQQTGRQTPERRVEKQQKNIVIARNPNPPLKIPEDVLAGLTDANWMTRKQAVQILDEEYIKPSDPQVAPKVLRLLLGRLTGEKMETDFRVRSAIEAVIAASEERYRSVPKLRPEPSVPEPSEPDSPIQKPAAKKPKTPAPTSDKPPFDPWFAKFIRNKWWLSVAFILLLAVVVPKGYIPFGTQKMLEGHLGKPLTVFQDTLSGGGKASKMVVIPAGSFVMGSPKSEQGRNADEGPQHKVNIQSFALGKYEVTFAEYDQFAEATGRWRYKPSDEGWGRKKNQPVINVNWKDATVYAEWLSEQTGKRYRLPSEAEWEYAARAGTTTPFSTGRCINTDQANYDGNYDYNDCGAKTGVYRRQTVPVTKLGENAWRLAHMHGNVWEWILDCARDSYEGAPTDGSAWEKDNCSKRVLRGGSWDDEPRNLRSAFRVRVPPGGRDDSFGFRLARTL